MTGPAVHDGPISEGGAVATRTPTGLPAEAGSSALDVPANLSPAALIYFAIQKGVSPDSLEKLAAIQERFEKRQAEKDFIEALAEFRRRCPDIRKNKTANIKTDGGGSYSYKYAELDEIAHIVDPILESLGFSYSWNTTATEKAVTVECVLMHKGTHAKSSFFTVPVESKSGMSPQQKYGAASTFAQRRTLANVLGLTTTEKDYDGAAVDPTVINEDQVVALKDRVKEVCRGDQAERFLAYMGVKSIEEIRVAQYGKANASLDRVKQANDKADARAS